MWRTLSTIAVLTSVLTLCGCAGFFTRAPGFPRSGAEATTGYFYIPLDPLPVAAKGIYNCPERPASSEMGAAPKESTLPGQDPAAQPTPTSSPAAPTGAPVRSTVPLLLARLPDNSVRVAVRDVSGSTKLGFAGNEIGLAGKSYQVILDYINVDVTNVQFGGKKWAQGGPTEDRQAMGITEPVPAGSRVSEYSVYRTAGDTVPDFVIPVYVGIGLRLSASVTVRKGEVNLASLGAIAAAAEAEVVNGTLLVQTLGITGPKVSSALPLPSELNPTTVQNAILALGTIKAGLYSPDSVVNARVVGFHNTTGIMDQAFVNKIISALAADPIPWNPCETTSALATGEGL